MQKALIVKDDGLIYAAEVPESLKDICFDEGCFGADFRAWQHHQMEMDSAKKNAVLVSDQEKARKMILQLNFNQWIKDGENEQDLGKGKYSVKPGIYPIPDLQWELEHRELGKVTLEEPASHTGTFWVTWKGGRTNAYLDDIVAILKESSTEQESQEDLIDELLYETYGADLVGREAIAKKFTITRRKP